MDLEAILALVGRGVSIAAGFLTADNIAAAERTWAAVRKIIKPPEEVTQAELDALEAELDVLLAEFNVPL